MEIAVDTQGMWAYISLREEPETVRMIGLPELILCILIAAAIVVPYWKIFSKAGFSRYLSLLMVIPFANLILLYYVAFAEWPLHRQMGKR